MLKKMFNPPSEPTYSPLDDEHIVDFQRRQIRRWRLRFFYLSGFYIFALLVALGILLKQALYRAETLFPDFSRRSVVFEENASFIHDVPGQNNSIWDSFLPKGVSFITVEDPARWGLSGGFPIEEHSQGGSEQYGVSMLHQFHCLATIKRGFDDLKQRTRSLESTEHENAHLGHCFDYLRQAIMCSADLTLEKAIVREGEVTQAVDGWGVIHECRDWNEVYQYIYVHRSNNFTGILNPA